MKIPGRNDAWDGMNEFSFIRVRPNIRAEVVVRGAFEAQGRGALVVAPRQ